MKILIVDDEALALEAINCLVHRIKPESKITCADNYEDALSAAERTMFDVAFLDIEMPEMDGLTLAKRLKDVCPDVNIIFATAYSEYAVQAFSIYASGYLLKPVQKQELEEAFEHLRTPVCYEEGKLRVQCFGNFEVFFEGQPVVFKRSLAKELLAYLIDLRGASANTAQLCAVLWEDSAKAMENRHYFRNIVSELKKVLKACRAEKALICRRNLFAIDISQVECDYYKFLTQTSHIKNGTRSLKNQYFSSQNNTQAAL